jgi:GNAT superfamily N-acetyltransferase
MSQSSDRQRQFAAALKRVKVAEGVKGVELRCWSEEDFPAIQGLSALEGWTTSQRRPEESLDAWRKSWPALVVTEGENVIGFVRGMTDGEVTMYIADLLVEREHRGKGLGRLLLDACHELYPRTRLDLISTAGANSFYKADGFRFVGEGLRKSYE